MVASRPNIDVRAETPFVAVDDQAVRCVVMRGGTSRGLFFHEQDLPYNPTARDKVIMGAVGAPDPRHVDGLGGGDMLLSKVAIIGRSDKPGIDLECEFANITPGKQRPTYGTNCGNLVAAAALFALEQGLVTAGAEPPTLRILNRNASGIIKARVSRSDSACREEHSLAGMPESGACVDLDFLEPVGAYQEQLLPTGNPRDTLELEGLGTIDVSVVDAGALYVFVRDRDLGIQAAAALRQKDKGSATLRQIEEIRAIVARKLGIVGAADDAVAVSPDVPKVAIVGSPISYQCDNSSKHIEADAIDLVARIISSQNYHKAYAVTGAIATAVASAVAGSVVQRTAGSSAEGGTHKLRIGHPGGVLACQVASCIVNGRQEIAFARIRRTARRVSQGSVFVPASI